MNTSTQTDIIITGLTLASVVFSAFSAYGLSMLFDKYFSTDVDAAIIRRIEEMNQARPIKIPTILSGMEIEDRLRVLEKVLDFRTWSKELSAQVKLDQAKKDEAEKIIAAERALLIKSEPPEQANTEIQQIVGAAESSTENGTNDDLEEKTDDTNILVRVWNEFGQKGKGNKSSETKDEVTETCAICMEDYEDCNDVVIGEGCVHMYHKECLLKWMQAKHDFCPYCRCYAFDVQKFLKVAKEQVGDEKYNELVENDDPDLVATYMSISMETGSA